jgi:type I site-specific restriction-modification system R (restriction) subunit
VLYVNGIAIGVLELKNSRVSIGDGIRQSLSNQQPDFNAWFFSTVQFIFAGNDSEGLQYGTIGTEEKYFLKWKEDETDNSRFKLDKYLLKLCRRDRIIELMHGFVLFDGGIKKGATGASVFRHQGGATACARPQGRHYLAHAGQRQKHRDGAAGEVDSGEQS